MKTKYYFIDRAEKVLNDGFSFSEHNFDSIIEDLEQREEQFEHITWEQLKAELINNGWQYCYWEESIVDDEYAKELGLIDDDEEDDEI